MFFYTADTSYNHFVKDMKTMPGKEKSCGVILFRMQEGNIQTLLIHQHQGHWCFPKGHMKQGETERQTAAREVQEETGVKVRFLNGFRETTHYRLKENTEKEVVFFAGVPAGGKEKRQKEEVLEMKWLSLSEAQAVLTFPSDAEVLKKAFRFLKQQGGKDLLKEHES